jgi:hypothetical protein
MEEFYVYMYLDPRKPGKYKYGDYCFLYEPFYVGKGKDDRYNICKCGRSKYFINKINKIKKLSLNPIIVKFKENITENESFELEGNLIKLIGRKDLNLGPLINMTNGGDGTSGKIIKEKILKKSRKNFQDIKNEFKSIGYQLLTKENEYKNNKQKLYYICSSGHKHFLRWNDFSKRKKM